jgi:hypothetical protein
MPTMSNMLSHKVLRLALLVLPALTGACTHSDDSESPTILASAVIHNDLPSDGCSYPVTIGDKDFAPDQESLDAIRARGLSFGATTVMISYRPTGRTGTVHCGFSDRQLPEITLYFEG